MQEPVLSRYEQIRARRMQSPEFRDRYARTRRSIDTMQEVIRLIDEQRQQAGLSKAELARRVGANPAAMRRLLTSGSGNPTLKTLLDVLDVLGIELRFQVKVPSSGAEQQDGSWTPPAAPQSRRTVLLR